MAPAAVVVPARAQSALLASHQALVLLTARLTALFAAPFHCLPDEQTTKTLTRWRLG